MAKAKVEVGYGDSLRDYQSWSSPEVVGVDLKATDGLGNVIEVNVRDGDIGYRITLNGQEIRSGDAPPFKAQGR